MKHTNKFTGSMLLMVSSGIFMVSGYVINILLGRVLGPELYGFYGVLVSIISFINIMQSAGLTQSVSKYVAEGKSDPEAILKTGLIMQLFFSLFLILTFFLAADLIANVLNNKNLVPYLHIAAFVFPGYGLYALFSDYFNGKKQFHTQAFANMLYGIIRLVIILIGASIWKVTGALFGFIVGPLLAIAPFLFLPKSKEVFPKKKLLLFSLPFVSFALLANILQSFDILFVQSIVQNQQQTGFYTAAQNIAKIPYYTLNALFMIIFPLIASHTGQGRHRQATELINTISRFVLMLLIPLTSLLAVLSEHMIRFVYSDTYLTATNPTAILVIGIACFTFFVFLSYMLSGSGKPHIPLLIALIAITLFILLNLTLIPLLGLAGAALATTMSSIAALILAVVQAHKQLGFSQQITSIGRMILATAVICLIARYLPVNAILLPFYFLFLFGMYGMLLIVMKELTRIDWYLLQSFLPTKRL
jgi:stage V sporulation protein B